MKKIQIIKRLNSTELGKGNTNDTYVLVDQSLDVSELFPTPDEQIVFTDFKTKKEYSIRLTVGREKRIPGLGQFFRDNHMEPGDYIVLEKSIAKGKENYLIGCIYNSDYLAINYRKDLGFEVLIKDRIERFNNCGVVYVNDKRMKISILFNRTERKRSDSPALTDYYSITVDNYSLENVINPKGIDGLEIHGNCIYLVNNSPWRRYEVETEDVNE